MSAILIHKSERNQEQIIPENKHENIITDSNPMHLKWEDFAGLSWILLEKEEDY